MSVATPPPGQYTVLRIKRKATDAPLSSLGVCWRRFLLPPAPTFPLSSLRSAQFALTPVISDERAPKRRDVRAVRGRGVFRLAETVPHTWRGEGAECEMLKVRWCGPDLLWRVCGGVSGPFALCLALCAARS